MCLRFLFIPAEWQVPTAHSSFLFQRLWDDSDFSTSFAASDGALYYLSETRPGIWQRFEFVLPGGGRLGRYVKGFGEDEMGELYLLSTTDRGPNGTSGDIRRLRQP